MKLYFYKLYVKSIRKIINHSFLKNFLIKNFPGLYSFSESIYVRFKDAESNFLDILSDKSKTSIDIGALWGGYSLLLKRFSKKLLIFEPNNNNYNFLLKSLRSNKNIEIINAAVSDKSNSATLKIPENNPGNATIESENKFDDINNVREYKVTTKKIDDLNIKNIGFIKIDIEGHEYSAVRGMAELLKDQRPNLLIEIEERHNAGSIERVTSFFKTIEYDIYFIADNIIHPFKDYSIDVYQNSGNRNTRKYINNFIFIPREKSGGILSLFSERAIIKEAEKNVP
jgi:FkbM family methyltransferase